MESGESRVESIFHAATEKKSPDERAAYLDEACAGDDELRRRVEKLLGAAPKLGGFLQGNAADGMSTEEIPPVTERPGTMIGLYRLMEEIGEGGMGVVYVAEQRQPVRRKVALKIIKPGMDTKEVIARFEAERQALALMDHPNIAKVFDAGSTESGRPYFVMELVRGIPITDYCDQNNLSTRERLDLFVTVCHAIKHAHQKGIIHRDVKPSNVMITLHDGKPVPMVIDFGVAKAVNQQLTERTIYTRYAQMIGTPLYMSPEQAEMSGLDVDTRSDIYSLGVLLYELLTGTTPFAKKRIHEAAYDEIRRIIREEEPPKPSTRISTLGKAAAAISAHRKADPKRLGQLVRGDLDWIVMKALEKDRTRRYETAAELAADVVRHLSHEPILAGRPSALYRLRKFARRHKGAVATAGVVTAAVLLGLVVSTFLAIVATRAKRDALVERQSAIVAWKQADEQFKQADAARQLAASERDNNRRLLYVADMSVAQQAWEAGNVDRVTELLKRYEPGAGDSEKEDLRGFQWRHLQYLSLRSRNTPSLSHGSRIMGMGFSPDGRTLATIGYGPHVKLWDVLTAMKLWPAPPPPPRTIDYGAMVSSLAFSPDGTTLATGRASADLWDLSTGEHKARLPFAGTCVASMAFSSDGSILAAGGFGEVVELWDVASRQSLRTLRGHDFEIFNVALSPDGKTLASASPCKVIVWDTNSGEKRHVLGEDVTTGWGVAFAPDGKTLASSGPDGTVWLWDPDTGQLQGSLEGRTSGFGMSLAYASNGRLAAASADGTVILWDPNTGRKLDVLKGHQHWVWVVRFSPDSRTLASAGIEGKVKLWDVAAPRPVDLLKGHTQQVTSLAFLPDGSALVSGCHGGTVRIWDIQTGQELADRLQHQLGVEAVATSPDGRTAASLSWDHKVALWDLASGQPTRRLQQSFPLSAAFSPDATHLAVGGGGPRLTLWDLVTETPEYSVRGHRTQMHAVAISPNGQLMASGGWDKRVKLWDLETGAELHDFEEQGGDVECLAFSPDGKTLASGDTDNAVVLWDIDSYQRRQTLTGHTGPVNSLAFSPDGEILASGANDRTIRLWYLDAAKEPEILPEYAPVTSVAFSPDGTILASGSGHHVRLWRTVAEKDPRKLASLANLQRRAHEIADADPQEQRQIVGDLKSHLAAGAAKGLLLRDVILAASTAWRLEDSGQQDLAAEAFRTFGEAIAASGDPRFSDFASVGQAALWEHRARLCVEARQYDQAILHFTNAIAIKPDDLQLLVTRGQLYACQSQWKEAAADHVRATRLEPTNAMTWLRSAPLLVLAGDREGYHKLCEDMLHQFAESEKVGDAGRSCKACLLLPGTVEASKLPLRALETALDEGSASSGFYKWGYATRALAAYRAGEADKAVHWIRKSQQSQGYADEPRVQALALSLLALVQHQLGKRDEASEALAEADTLIDEYLPKLTSGELDGWHDWLIAEILRREAEAALTERNQ